MAFLSRFSFPDCLPFALLVFSGCGRGIKHINLEAGRGNPVPSVGSVNPPAAMVGGAALTITVTGSNFISSSVVEWNEGALATSYQGATSLAAQVTAADLESDGMARVTVVNPAPGGGTSLPLTFKVIPAPPPGVTFINTAVNDLAWDPVKARIYLSLPSADGTNGNSIQVLDPTTGTLGAATFVGSEPNLLAVSATSQYLYASLNGASSVVQMTLPNLAINNTIALGDGEFGPFYALDLQAAPNADGTIAVVRGTPGVSPEEQGGVVLYDDGTARPDVLCGWTQQGCPVNSALYDSIQWNSNASEMFAANNEDTGFDFYTIPVTSAGFGEPTDYPGDLSSFHVSIHYDAVTGYVYDDGGRVIDPADGALVGSFSASGIMVPDGSLGRAYFLGQTQSNSGSGTYTLESFDIQHFTPIATMSIPDVIGTPSHLIRWGSDGLAFTTNAAPATPGSAVYLISGSFVTGASSSVQPGENVQRTWKMHRTFRGDSTGASRLWSMR